MPMFNVRFLQTGCLVQENDSWSTWARLFANGIANPTPAATENTIGILTMAGAFWHLKPQEDENGCLIRSVFFSD